MHIITKFLGPTNHRGARIVASMQDAHGKTVRHTITWDHALDVPANHLAAMWALAVREGKTPARVVSSDDSTGYVFIFDFGYAV